MATKRFSTDTYVRKGTKKNFKDLSGKLTATFADAVGNEKAIEATEIILGTFNYVPGSISKDSFYTVRSYFIKRGVSATNADSMSLLINDAAKAADTSPITLAYAFGEDDEVVLSVETYIATNFFRPPTDQIMVLIENDNKSSFRNRNVIT